jgi:hypothetical protein
MILSTEACKCYNNNGQRDPVITQKACGFTGGIFEFGEDCRASSISNKLSTFRYACQIYGGTGSDCPCPEGCVKNLAPAPGIISTNPKFNVTYTNYYEAVE